MVGLADAAGILGGESPAASAHLCCRASPPIHSSVYPSPSPFYLPKSKFMPTSLRLLTLALLLLPLGLVGCDAIEEVTGLNAIDISLGDAGNDLPVAPNTLAYQAQTVSVGQDIPGTPGVGGIDIDQEDVTFTPVAFRGGGPAGSCDLNVTLLIDDAPAVSGNVVITDNVVTGVTAGYASPDYDRARLCEAIGTESCPIGNLTGDQIDDIVESGLNSGNFEVGVVVDNPGDCQGTLDIDAVTFDLDL